jgi:hypothetical protein
MDDVRTAFRAVDDVRAPDLRSEIEQRARRHGDVTSIPRSSSRRSLALLAACLAAVSAVAVTISVVSRTDPAAIRSDAVVVPHIDPNADAGWLTGDGAQAHCVETFSVDRLSGRDWAFEGVVTDVQVGDPSGLDPEPTRVIFAVERWFFGGSGGSFTAKTYESPGSITSAGSSGGSELSSAIGAHLLATGDEQFIWACGFTQEYTASGATAFERAELRR